jgi:peptide/nickel transport system substrate-binding protein
MARLWEMQKAAVKEPNQAKRDAIVFEMTKIHINEGPFFFGMIANPTNIVIVGNKLKNVPNHDQIPGGGWLGPWVVDEPGAITYPEQYYFES